MRVSYLLAGIALAGTIATAVPDPAAAVQRTCFTNRIEQLTFGSAVTTSAQSFSTIPGATVTLTNVSDENDCFTIHWSADVKAQLPQVLRLRVLVNGTPAGNPVDFSAPTAAFEGRSFTFALPSTGVAATIEFQIMSVKGGAVAVRRQNIAIPYAFE